MLLTAKLPPIFWEVAVLHACYLINRTPHSGIKNELPYTRWYGKKPDLSHLRIFGAPVYVHITTEEFQAKKKRKLVDPKAWRGIYVGHVDYDNTYIYMIQKIHRLRRDTQSVNGLKVLIVLENYLLLMKMFWLCQALNPMKS